MCLYQEGIQVITKVYESDMLGNKLLSGKLTSHFPIHTDRRGEWLPVDVRVVQGRRQAVGSH